MSDNFNRLANQVPIHLESQLLQGFGVIEKLHGELILFLQIFLSGLIFIDSGNVPPNQLDLAGGKMTELEGERLTNTDLTTWLIIELLRLDSWRSTGEEVQMQQAAGKTGFFENLACCSFMASLAAITTSFGQDILVALYETKKAYFLSR